MSFYLQAKDTSLTFPQFEWPLMWSIVCQYCSDLLTSEQLEAGYYNSGVKIEAWQAQLIADRLSKITYEVFYTDDMAELRGFLEASNGFYIW